MKRCYKSFDSADKAPLHIGHMPKLPDSPKGGTSEILLPSENALASQDSDLK